ncbi:MAG: hypothetical protein ACE5EX_03105 [Phycisphaerae bacterium]
MYLTKFYRHPVPRLLVCPGALALVVGCPPDTPMPGGGVNPTCGVGTLGPTTHTETEITADTTWTAATSPHIVTRNLTIRNGATLTVEPCAYVRVDPDVQITAGLNSLDETGTLEAMGTATDPIRFLANGTDRWSNLRIHAPGNARLAYVTIEGAGSDEITYDGASLVVWGDNQPPLATIADVDNVTVMDSPGYGVLVERWGGFTANATGLTVTGSGGSLTAFPSPVRADAQVLGTLPPGSYTGNATDEILVVPTQGIKEDVTVSDLGVPYRITNIPSAALNVTDDAVLTINAGVQLHSEADMQFRFGNAISGGALRALGQVGNPILFTSAGASPQAGDWVGLEFLSPPPAGASNMLDWVRIEYAGGDCSCGGRACPTTTNNDAALLILDWEPTASFLTNSTIANSAGNGILRGWVDATCGGNVLDMGAGNTFTNVALADQTTPKFQQPACQSQCP